ncbi:hypothetical protein K438DRAFT_1201955 [Mycena galopus ATCC 62051]|nr:hypothetical protein K438DRAFT_1201955 [Mycena galopus ATCC 62051]
MGVGRGACGGGAGAGGAGGVCMRCATLVWAAFCRTVFGSGCGGERMRKAQWECQRRRVNHDDVCSVRALLCLRLPVHETVILKRRSVLLVGAVGPGVFLLFVVCGVPVVSRISPSARLPLHCECKCESMQPFLFFFLFSSI